MNFIFVATDPMLNYDFRSFSLRTVMFYILQLKFTESVQVNGENYYEEDYTDRTPHSTLKDTHNYRINTIHLHVSPPSAPTLGVGVHCTQQMSLNSCPAWISRGRRPKLKSGRSSLGFSISLITEGGLDL